MYEIWCCRSGNWCWRYWPSLLWGCVAILESLSGECLVVLLQSFGRMALGALGISRVVKLSPGKIFPFPVVRPIPWSCGCRNSKGRCDGGVLVWDEDHPLCTCGSIQCTDISGGRGCGSWQQWPTVDSVFLSQGGGGRCMSGGRGTNAQTHTRHPPHQHSPGTPTTGLRERGNDTSRSTDPSQHAKGRTGDGPGPQTPPTPCGPTWGSRHRSNPPPAPLVGVLEDCRNDPPLAQ